MLFKRVSIGDMFGWIGKSFGMVFANPGTLFGAGLLMVVVIILVAMPSFVVMGPMMGATPGTPPDFAQLWPRIAVLYGLMITLNVVLMPPLILGWLRLVSDLDHNRATGATAIFRPFSDTPAWMAGIRLCLLTLLAVLVLVVVFVVLFWKTGSNFASQVAAAEAARAAGMDAPASGFPGMLVLAYVLFMLTMVFVQFASFLGYTELALRGGGATRALLAGFHAVLKNLVGLLLFFVLVGLICFVLALVLGLLLGLVIALLAAISPMAMMVGMALLYIPLLLLMYPLMHASTYLAWKDMLGGDADADTGADPAGQVSI